VITVKNRSHELLIVTHSGDPDWREPVKPLGEAHFHSLIHGHYCIERVRPRRIDPRFDPRGGDPYNRVGPRAVPS
jgi:hypothetical protein